MRQLIEQLWYELEQISKGPAHTPPSTSSAFKQRRKVKSRFKRMKGGLLGLPRLGGH